MRVRIVLLDEQGLRGLDEEWRSNALSMVGEIFPVEEFDAYGHPCVTKEFPGVSPDTAFFHSVYLDPHEFEVVDAVPPTS